MKNISTLVFYGKDEVNANHLTISNDIPLIFRYSSNE